MNPTEQEAPDRPSTTAHNAAGALDRSGFERRGFADQLSIETPEQVSLEFPVAGIGSRFVAVLLDHLIQVGIIVGAGLGLVMISAAMGARTRDSLASKWFIAGVIFAGFLLIWGYFALFEAFWRGQTPGKRAMKLRVIKDAGRQVTLFEAMARNLLRVVDYMPGLYLAGVITMLCNARNKRLGDLAAGTMVVHERGDAQPLLYTGNVTSAEPWRTPSGGLDMFPADAVARLGSKDLIVIDAFFARALDLPLETRAAMAGRIAGEMAAKMGVSLPEGNPERALEAMVVALRRQGQRS